MKRTLALCLLLLFACSPATTAQKKQKRFCPVPPPSPFKHNGEIVTSFDPKARGMRTTLQHPNALGRAGEPVYLSASFVHQPAARAAQTTVEVVFVSTSPVFKYRDRHDLVLFCDGRRWAPGVRARYESRTVGQGVAFEATRVSLSFEDLQAVTSSRRVTARLGPTELALTQNHLEALRELASLIAPSPGRWRTAE